MVKRLSAFYHFSKWILSSLNLFSYSFSSAGYPIGIMHKGIILSGKLNNLFKGSSLSLLGCTPTHTAPKPWCTTSSKRFSVAALQSCTHLPFDISFFKSPQTMMAILPLLLSPYRMNFCIFSNVSLFLQLDSRLLVIAEGACIAACKIFFITSSNLFVLKFS